MSSHHCLDRRFKPARFLMVAAFVLTLGAVLPAEAGTLICGTAPAISLSTLVACIEAHMPGKGQEGFVVPDAATQEDWRLVVTEMLAGHCDDPADPDHIILPPSLSAIYSIGTYIEQPLGLYLKNGPYNGPRHCVLMETLTDDVTGKVLHGWGTVIINSGAKRELNIQVPHPIADIGTSAEGAGIFLGSEARSLIMAGTHRKTNSAFSACQPGLIGEDGEIVKESDAAHNVDTLFQPAVHAVSEFYALAATPFVALQFHGMGSSCPDVDVYLTYGLKVPPVPGDPLSNLKSNLKAHHPLWAVTVPGDVTTCSLHGTANVQGRLLNNVTPICGTMPGPFYSGTFIHIEQKPDFRKAYDWILAIIDTWPVP